MIRRLALAALFGFVACIATMLWVGSALTAPANRPVGSPPPELGASAVAIPVGSSFVKGWFAQGELGAGAVLLLHGVRSDRHQMLGRARFLREAGYSVLLIDLQAHGESPGEYITFGDREREGVLASLAFLRHELPTDPIGVIGVSLGAASIVLAHPSPAPDAVVLESMYPCIEAAVSNRLSIRFGVVGARLAPLLLWQLPLRLGIPTDRLQPIDAVSTIGAPVLFASGTEDQHTTWRETENIFAAAAEPKDLWKVPGAAHVDLYKFAPIAYKTKILTFFSKWLRMRPNQSFQPTSVTELQR